MDTAMDYDVHTQVSFLLALPDVQSEFTKHVQNVFQKDNTLGSYIQGDLTFRFDGRRVRLDYTFSCHDENAEEAESFSDYCLQGVRKDLESFGCKMTQVQCTAEEADMAWLDQMEAAIFGPQ